MPGYNEPGIETELARHSAWLAQTKLQNFIENASLSADAGNLENSLKAAILDITKTLEYLKKGGRSEP